MSISTSYLEELDDAISRGSREKRLEALWHATDLLIAGQYSDDQIWVFGEVISQLAVEIEEAARIELAKRLVQFDRSPGNLLGQLAFDDSIEVAGPVLRRS